MRDVLGGQGLAEYVDIEGTHGVEAQVAEVAANRSLHCFQVDHWGGDGCASGIPSEGRQEGPHAAVTTDTLILLQHFADENVGGRSSHQPVGQR